MFKFVPVLFLLIAGCAGVFTNPDLKDGGAALSLMQGRIKAFALVPAMERQLARSFIDSAYTVIPEREFFLYQDYLTNALLHGNSDSAPFINFSANRSTVSYLENLNTPKFLPPMYLSQISAQRFCVYTVDNMPPVMMRVLINNQIPILFFGKLWFKRVYPSNESETKIPINEGTDTLTTLTTSQMRMTLRMEMFDFVYSYSKLVGNVRYMPGEEGPEYLYETRSGMNFRAFDAKPLINQALPLYGHTTDNNHWLISNAYIILPDTTNMPALQQSLNESALRLGYEKALPALIKQH